MNTAKLVLWVSVISGFGWFSYFAIPLALTNTALIAQGTNPDWTLKDMANLGGFVVFSFGMFFLHRESIKTFREELKAERDARAAHSDKITEHLVALTTGMLSNTSAMQALTVEMRREKGEK